MLFELPLRLKRGLSVPLNALGELKVSKSNAIISKGKYIDLRYQCEIVFIITRKLELTGVLLSYILSLLN